MIDLYNKETEQFLGKISEEDLQFLIDNLVEEGLEEGQVEDDDYYINRTVFEMLKEKGMSADLVALIGTAMGDKDDVEIRYQREEESS